MQTTLRMFSRCKIWTNQVHSAFGILRLSEVRPSSMTSHHALTIASALSKEYRKSLKVSGSLLDGQN